MRLKMQRGDTLIEVLLATTIFAMVAVGSVTIMNQGASSAQYSLEVTQVRQQIDAQAEAIRYIHQAYIAAYNPDTPPATGTAAEWTAMTRKTTGGMGATTLSAYGQLDGNRCPATTPGERPFVLNAKTAKINKTVPLAMQASVDGSQPPFSRVEYSGNTMTKAHGIWVEAIPAATASGTGYVDFHIRACWESPSSSVPITLGTIVRLYEPR